MARASNTDYIFGLTKGRKECKSKWLDRWTRDDKWNKNHQQETSREYNVNPHPTLTHKLAA